MALIGGAIHVMSAAEWMYRAYWLQYEQLNAMLKLVDTKDGRGGIGTECLDTLVCKHHNGQSLGFVSHVYSVQRVIINMSHLNKLSYLYLHSSFLISKFIFISE